MKIELNEEVRKQILNYEAAKIILEDLSLYQEAVFTINKDEEVNDNNTIHVKYIDSYGNYYHSFSVPYNTIEFFIEDNCKSKQTRIKEMTEMIRDMTGMPDIYFLGIFEEDLEG